MVGYRFGMVKSPFRAATSHTRMDTREYNAYNDAYMDESTGVLREETGENMDTDQTEDMMRDNYIYIIPGGIDLQTSKYKM